VGKAIFRSEPLPRVTTRPPPIRRARSARPTSADPPSAVLRPPPALRLPPFPALLFFRPSPASSVSALRDLCDPSDSDFAPLALFRGQPLRSAARGAHGPPWRSSVRLLLPLCPRSVASVTKSDSVVRLLLPLCQHSAASVKKSVVRPPSSVLRHPSSVLRSLPFLLFKSFRVFRVFRGPKLRPPPSDFAPLALFRGQPSVRPVCKIFLPLKFSYLYGSEGGGRKIGW
jgi:hypothetical protein